MRKWGAGPKMAFHEPAAASRRQTPRPRDPFAAGCATTARRQVDGPARSRRGRPKAHSLRRRSDAAPPRGTDDQRKAGSSAVAGAAYRSASRLRDEARPFRGSRHSRCARTRFLPKDGGAPAHHAYADLEPHWREFRCLLTAFHAKHGTLPPDPRDAGIIRSRASSRASPSRASARHGGRARSGRRRRRGWPSRS